MSVIQSRQCCPHPSCNRIFYFETLCYPAFFSFNGPELCVSMRRPWIPHQQPPLKFQL